MELIYSLILYSIPGIIFSWILPQKYQIFPSMVVTCLFLVIHNPSSLIALSLSSLIGYLFLSSIKNVRTAAFLSAGGSLGMLILYKLQGSSGITNLDIEMIGLSYYAFRQIHVAIEHYNRSLNKINLLNYISYLFFLPTLLVGPINTMNTFEKDRLKRRVDYTLFSNGLERILYGLVKINFIGNYLFNRKLSEWTIRLINTGQINEFCQHYLNAFEFVGNSYIQFSGYSDIAIGLSALFGYRIIENFNYPFLSINIAEFWKRWHISLSEWCRQYVFLPIMGKTRSAFIGLLSSMLVLGIWHEVSWKYFIWAIVQGLALIVWNQYKQSLLHAFLNQYRWNRILSWFINSNFVIVSFYILSFDSFEQFLAIFISIFKNDI